MKELSREQCSHIAGGDPGMVLAGGGGGGGGGGFGFGGSSFGSGGIDFGSGSIGFDSNGIGPLSCTPAPSVAANGWFGLSVAETLGVGTGGLALISGLGQGYGASLAIEAAGGLGAVGQMGAAGAGLMGSAALGLGSALITSGVIGTLAYDNIEFVRDGAQWTVGTVLTGIEGIGNAVVQLDTWLVEMPIGRFGRLFP